MTDKVVCSKDLVRASDRIAAQANPARCAGGDRTAGMGQSAATDRNPGGSAELF